MKEIKIDKKYAVMNKEVMKDDLFMDDLMELAVKQNNFMLFKKSQINYRSMPNELIDLAYKHDIRLTGSVERINSEYKFKSSQDKGVELFVLTVKSFVSSVAGDFNKKVRQTNDSEQFAKEASHIITSGIINSLILFNETYAHDENEFNSIIGDMMEEINLDLDYISGQSEFNAQQYVKGVVSLYFPSYEIYDRRLTAAKEVIRHQYDKDRGMV